MRVLLILVFAHGPTIVEPYQPKHQGKVCEFGQGSKVEIANQACTIKTQTKLIKKSREYNSKDLTLALYNIDNSKKSVYCGYMDGNSDLMGVERSS